MDTLGTKEAARLQQDIWTLWRAVSRQGDDSRARSRARPIEFATSEKLATSLARSPREIAAEPANLAMLLEAHESLSGLLYPATPESIRLSEAYQGRAGRPDMTEDTGETAAWRQATRLRILFQIFTVFALIVLGLSVLISIQAAIGSSALREATAAFEDLSKVRIANATIVSPTPADEIQRKEAQNNAAFRVSAALSQLTEWMQGRVVETLTGRRPTFPDPDRPDPTLTAAASADLLLMTTIVLPLLAGFLGAYCEFVRWFTRRLLAMAVTPGDYMQIIVRFMLALAATSVLASFSRGVQWPDMFAFTPVALAFLLGYGVSQVFGMLDNVLSITPTLMLTRGVERATQRAVEKTQASQITALKGSVEEVIRGPTVVNYQGQVGIDLRDGSRSVLHPQETASARPVRADLTPGQTIGRALQDLPVLDSLSVEGGEDAKEVTFDVEVESALLPARRISASGSPSADKPWTHHFELPALERAFNPSVTLVHG